MIRFRFSILQEIRCFQVCTRSWVTNPDKIGKRGAVLDKMLANKDRNKKWYFQIMQNPPKSKNVFERVHRPNKRQSVLESLFIKNITDVLSTGDIYPELIGSGVEIVGVKMNPSCRELKVYWEIPPSKFDYDIEYSTLLNLKAPKLRAELISRNVLGRVPFICFVRDISNAYLANFEKALHEADFGPKDRVSIVSEDLFTTKKRKIYLFNSGKEGKVEVKKKYPPVKEYDDDRAPPRPLDMKCDVFGINHDKMMDKVISIKALSKPDGPNNIISSVHMSASTDLFSNIPGTTIDGKSDREQLLKEFHIQRKILKKKESKRLSSKDYAKGTDDSFEDDCEDFVVEGDFIDEEP